MKICGYQLRQTADAFSSQVTASLLPRCLGDINLNECWGSRIRKTKVPQQVEKGLSWLCSQPVLCTILGALPRVSTNALMSPKKSKHMALAHHVLSCHTNPQKAFYWAIIHHTYIKYRGYYQHGRLTWFYSQPNPFLTVNLAEAANC